MTSEWLRYLIAVADDGSISRAARECSISQPALTQCIQKAEAEIGQPLFLRRNHGVELTDCGRIFINNARAMLFVGAQMEMAMEELKRKGTRQLHLFLEEKIRNVLYRMWMGPFHEIAPEAEVQISTGSTQDGEAYLLQDLAELAVFYTDRRFRKELAYDILVESEYFLAVPEGSETARHLAAHPPDLRCLEEETFILNSGKTEIRFFQQKILEKYHLYPRKILEADQITTVRHMVGKGYGVGFLPDALAREEGEEYQLFSLPEPFFYQTVLARRKDRRLSRLAEQFREMVLEKSRKE